MGEYDKALMAFYTSVFTAKVQTGQSGPVAARDAREALGLFKQQFPRPDFRNRSEY